MDAFRNPRWSVVAARVAPLFLAAVRHGESAAAEFGGCYDASTNTVRCAFTAADCEAPDGEAWATAAELGAMGLGCGCASTAVGACYDHVATHVADCRAVEAQCPDTTSWIAPGYDFSDGGACTCATDSATTFTAFGTCVDGGNGGHLCALDEDSCSDAETWVDPADASAVYGIHCARPAPVRSAAPFVVGRTALRYGTSHVP